MKRVFEGPGFLRLVMLPMLAVAIVAGACRATEGEMSDETADAAAPPPGANLPPSEPAGESVPSGPAGTGLATGLPCDVQGVIENRCIACHAATAPPPLLKYEDLIAKSEKDKAKTMAEVSVGLMKSKLMPPPPAVAPEDDEVLAFENWVKAGAPKNATSCTSLPGRGDGGTSPPVADAGAPVIDAGGGGLPLGDGGCTSGKRWTDGNEGSPLMHPGAACNACHQQSGGPNLRIAGTVFPTLRDPTDCIGSAPPPQITVTITDSRQPNPRTITLNANASGNFQTRERLTLPIKAVVREGNRTREMKGTVNSGDCNSCHTESGRNGAPGRIVAP